MKKMQDRLALHTWTVDTTPLAAALAAARDGGFNAVELRRVDFTRWSDIDLASRGIPSEQFLTAIDTVLHMSPEFKIDLVELETCRPAVLKSIEAEGKPL